MHKKRKHHRHQTSHIVQFKLPPVSDAAFELSAAENVSEGGICLHTSQLLPVYKLLKLYFSIPQCEDRISCVGKVVWVKNVKSYHPFKMGIEFVKIDEHTKKKVINHLQLTQ